MSQQRPPIRDEKLGTEEGYSTLYRKGFTCLPGDNI